MLSLCPAQATLTAGSHAHLTGAAVQQRSTYRVPLLDLLPALILSLAWGTASQYYGPSSAPTFINGYYGLVQPGRRIPGLAFRGKWYPLAQPRYSTWVGALVWLRQVVWFLSPQTTQSKPPGLPASARAGLWNLPELIPYLSLGSPHSHTSLSPLGGNPLPHIHKGVRLGPSVVILTLNLLVHEHRMSFQLLWSFKISFNNVLSVCKSYTSY